MDDLGLVAHSLDVTYIRASPTVAALIQHLGQCRFHCEHRQAWQGVVSSYPLHALPSAGASGLTVYIVDDRRRLVPLGCVGELFISGPQLSRGYLHKPEETSRVFVSDPFWPGSLIHRDTQHFFHLLNEQCGKELSERFAHLLSHEAGSVIFGLHLGAPEAILQTTPAGTMFFPSPTTWKMMWQSVFPSESVKVEAEVVKGHQNMAKAYAGSIEDPMKIWLLMWSIERYNRLRVEAGEIKAVLQATIRWLWASTLRIADASLRIDNDFYAAASDSISAIWLATAARHEAGIPLRLPATDTIYNSMIRAMTQVSPDVRLLFVIFKLMVLLLHLFFRAFLASLIP
ncbi:AMP-binding-domain-containing protein [Ramaria rubella]|nr:AMP-binding-domain-containing protein [Ramaria rubella]